MGYSGLETITNSDDAADLAHVVLTAAGKQLVKGVRESGNEFNTDGCVNVALIFEQCFTRSNDPCVYMNDSLRQAAFLAVARIEKLIAASQKAEWDDHRNKADHLRSYRRMLKSLGNFLAKSGD